MLFFTFIQGGRGQCELRPESQPQILRDRSRTWSFDRFATHKMWRTCDEAVLVKDQRVQLSTFIAAGQKVLLCSGNGDKTNAINCILRLIAWLVTDFNLKNYEIIRVLLFFLTIIRQIRLSLFHCRVILNSRKVRTGKILAENLRFLQLAEVPALMEIL